MRTILTKKEYAALKKRTISWVSHLIADGKISPAALIGEGVRARIHVEQADIDLLRSLDPAQQIAQSSPITSSGDPSPGAFSRPPVPGSEEEARRRILEANADRAEHEAEATRRKLAVDEGRWMVAAEAARIWNKELSGLIDGVERFLVTAAARDIAERHGCDWKPEATRLRQLFREHRAKTASEFKERRERLALAPPPAAE